MPDKENLEKIFTISLAPDLKTFALVVPSLEAVFKKYGFDDTQIKLYGVAVEEVFTYCAKMAAPNNRFWIDISIGLGKTSLHITIGYEGPGGSLAQYFTKGTKKKLKRTSFDALGLYIAQEVVNSLQYTGFGGKRNEFALSLTLPQSLEDHSE